MNLLETLRFLETHADYRDLSRIPGVRVELKYATSDNFMGRDVYGEFRKAFLHRLAAEKLERAAVRLLRARPGWKLVVFDALRPRSVQRVLWAHVEGTPQEAYVAQPDKGSVHNFGLAVDLGCLDESDRLVDMGTGFDSFEPLSQPKLESEFLESGRLTRGQVENRMILRDAMTASGFLQLPHEWWHYDALPRDQIRSGFLLIE